MGSSGSVIANLIKFHDFDIFGAQEVLHEQLNDLSGNLPEYSYIGVGRDNGKEAGEYAPILYKKGKFKLLKDGHFWLSEKTESPNKVGMRLYQEFVHGVNSRK